MMKHYYTKRYVSLQITFMMMMMMMMHLEVDDVG
jgi:hypothetical protein